MIRQASPSPRPTDESRQYGKDHLNLADWRISIPTFQQPLKKDGGKIDFAEYVIERPGDTAQRVMLEASSRTGLPTATDEDVLIGLLALAKQQDFQSDMVHFVPARLLALMNWPLKQQSFLRLKKSLKRLKAVTITYEQAWYSREKSGVEPTLITGILAEAKLVLRKGRRPKNAVPDSYIQWTNKFFTSLQEGNLTDLDLDLYFSWRRPGAKHLHRHLNKVWYGGRKPRMYERDLKQLACGHLGMKDNKDLKRNFDLLVQELEEREYVAPGDHALRYRKIRPGVWRVRFELHADRLQAGGKSRRSTAEKDQRADSATSDAAALVCLYHRHRFRAEHYKPRQHEVNRANDLLGKFEINVLTKVTPKVAGIMEQRFPDGLYLGAAVPHFETYAAEYQEQQERRNRREQQAVEASREEAAVSDRKHQQAARRAAALQSWRKLSEKKRAEEYRSAIEAQTSDFLKRFLRSRRNLETPPSQVLEHFAQNQQLERGE